MEKSTKVLLVDDKSDFRKLMTFWLKSRGYSVIETGDGRKAVGLVKKENPNIVLLDLRMPGMDGLDALRAIRKIDKKIPVIIISAHLDDPKAGELSSEEISGVFYKDDDFTKMLPLLEIALRTHKGLG